MRERASAGAPPAKSSQPVSTSSPKTAIPTTAIPKTAGTDDGLAPPCRTTAMSVVVASEPDKSDGDMEMGVVTINNRSKRTCQLEGHVTILLVNNDVVAVPTEEVDKPGPAKPITLEPGDTAYQGIKWQTCDKALEDCWAGNGLAFNLDGSADGVDALLIGLPAPERIAITMKSLILGTLQPTDKGVVDW